MRNQLIAELIMAAVRNYYIRRGHYISVATLLTQRSLKPFSAAQILGATQDLVNERVLGLKDDTAGNQMIFIRQFGNGID